ncbi:hypothetical protein AB0M02_22385 [Actinoplanes sp. NPDC051861]|uniref:hypothetical protein n=1 Tax=Actinoplanes sp. NPDC051861 TaxID=3155170 RepID=UPI0034360BEF
MTPEEKRWWIYALVAAAVPAIYVATVLSRAAGAGVAGVAYVGPLLTAIGAGIVANIVLSVLAGLSTRGGHRRDVRDREISRLGDHVGFYVMSLAAIVPFGLALGEADHFWIANTLYLAFVLAAFVSAAVKIVAYRRGFHG